MPVINDNENPTVNNSKLSLIQAFNTIAFLLKNITGEDSWKTPASISLVKLAQKQETLGLKGDKGDTGTQGIQGAKGDKGDTGTVGAQGAKGDKGDFSSIHPGFITGKYYPPHYVVNTTSGVLNTGLIYYTYFFIPKQQSFSAVVIQVASAAATAQNVRLGIYNIANGLPTSLVADLGTISISTATVKELSCSLNLLPGWYAIACQVDGNGASFLVPNSTLLIANVLGLNTATTNTSKGIRASFTYSVFPQSAPITNFTYGDVPFVWLKA